MKFSFVIFAIVFCCFTASTYAGATEPTIPTSISGYTTYNLTQVKSNSVLLNGYIAKASTFIVNAINAKKIYASSYSVFLRQAYRMTTSTGYQDLYYVKCYDHTNSTGYAYYGTFTITQTTTGASRVFKSYTVDSKILRSLL